MDYPCPLLPHQCDSLQCRVWGWGAQPYNCRHGPTPQGDWLLGLPPPVVRLTLLHAVEGSLSGLCTLHSPPPSLPLSWLSAGNTKAQGHRPPLTNPSWVSHLRDSPQG